MVCLYSYLAKFGGPFLLIDVLKTFLLSKFRRALLSSILFNGLYKENAFQVTIFFQQSLTKARHLPSESPMVNFKCHKLRVLTVGLLSLKPLTLHNVRRYLDKHLSKMTRIYP